MEKVSKENEWRKYIYTKLNLSSEICENVDLNTNNYKIIINELLSFIANTRQFKFIFNFELDNIRYNSDKRTFTLINLNDAKFKLTELTDSEYYFNFVSVYFSICKNYNDNQNVINYLKSQIVKYIPIKELNNFHLITNVLDLY